MHIVSYEDVYIESNKNDDKLRRQFWTQERNIIEELTAAAIHTIFSITLRATDCIGYLLKREWKKEDWYIGSNQNFASSDCLSTIR